MVLYSVNKTDSTYGAGTVECTGSPIVMNGEQKLPVGETVTLTVTSEDNYTIGQVSYNDGSDHTITPVNGVYSFAMPEQNVTVSATFSSFFLFLSF